MLLAEEMAAAAGKLHSQHGFLSVHVRTKYLYSKGYRIYFQS